MYFGDPESDVVLVSESMMNDFEVTARMEVSVSLRPFTDKNCMQRALWVT